MLLLQKWSQISFSPTAKTFSLTFLLIFFAINASASMAPADIEESFDQVNAATRIKDYATVHKLLGPLAEAGNAEAQYRLAGLYRSGRGVSQDSVVAFSLFQEAAQSDLAKAQYQLGVTYEKGLGVKADNDLARQWFEKASKQGHALAQKKLAQPVVVLTQEQKKSDKEQMYLAGSPAEVLRWAARRGLVEKVNQMLESGISPDGRDQFGRTALIEAAAYGHDDVLFSLLKFGADVNIRDNFQVNALLAAVERKNHNREMVSLEDCLACIELLIQYGANVDTRDRYGNTPLILAAKKDKNEVIKLLIDSGADIQLANSSGHNAAFYSKNNANLDLEQMFLSLGLSPSQKATYQNSEKDVVAQLISDEKEALVSSALHPEWSAAMLLAWRNKASLLDTYLQETKADINKQDESGQTALSLAAEQGYLDVVKVLVDHNADPSLVLTNGMTPLHLASKNGHVQVVDFLASSGIEINAKNMIGATPLLLALENGHDSVGAILLGKGADGNQASLRGISPLLLAVEKGLMTSFSLLLEHGVPVNHASNNGTTALITASKTGREFLVEKLLASGAHRDQADFFGNTSLSYAAMNNHTQITLSLIAAGANVNKVNTNGNTPLLLASSKGNRQVAEILLKAGAEIDHKNNIGNTPLMVAADEEHLDTVLLLLQNNASIRLKNKKGERVASLVSNNEEIANLIKSHTKGLDWVANFF